MKDCLSIGATPHDEPCAQVGAEDYAQTARLECGRFAAQIRRHYPEPENGYLVIKRSLHEFGAYFEVCAVFEDTDEEAVEWAYRCEADPLEVLLHWDTKAEA